MRNDTRVDGAARRPGRAAFAACLAIGLLALPGPARADGAEKAGARQVAVTFDDLPVISVTQLDDAQRADLTHRLMQSLKRHGVRATGFVNEYGLYGFAREPGPAPDPAGVDLLRIWIDSGHELANHGFAHRDLHQITAAEFCRDIELGEAVSGPLVKEKGMTLRFFRYPYLHTGRDLGTKRGVEECLSRKGYRIAPVTVDNEDYLFAAAYSLAAARGDGDLMRRIAVSYVAYTERAFAYSERLAAEQFGRPIPHVLLLHANALNADRFDALARMMRGRGYSFVTLDEALSDPAYDSPDDYTGAESINWLARWAVSSGRRTENNVLDDFPDVPEFVSRAAAR